MGILICGGTEGVDFGEQVTLEGGSPPRDGVELISCLL